MHGDSLKILVVSRLYPRPSDPVLGIFVAEEVKELSRRCQIRVVSPIPWFPPLKRFRKWYPYAQVPAREVRGSIEVFRPRTIAFPRNFLFTLLGFSFYLSLRRWINQIETDFPFDLIHAHTVYPDGFAAAMLGRALQRPTVITLHGGDVTLYLKRGLVRKMGLWALSRTHRIISVSRALRTDIVSGHGADPDRIAVIPNGVDVTRFAPMPRGEAQHRLTLEGSASRILYVGGIEKPKGIDCLLKAVARLAGISARPIELVLVGNGAYEREAKLLADALGIADWTNFVGKRPNTQIPLWINACDLVVLPSLSEGFGVVLVEAMACGKPVVATRCGGPEDIVTPETGILVPPGDEIALAKALHDVLSDQHRFDPQEIRRRAVDNYAYGNIASRITAVYRQVLHA